MKDSLLPLLNLGAVLPLVGRPKPHKDVDLVFFMPVFRDAEVAARALVRLRRAYPSSRVILLSDGDHTFPGEAFARDFRVEFVPGENLYGIRHGGRMLQRMLDLYLRDPARVLVRLDTDARIDRRFRRLPTRLGLYGRLGSRLGIVQGGCILLTHAAAARLHASRIFLSERLLDPAASWGRYSSGGNFRRKIEQGRIAYDKVLHWGCVEEGIPVRPFPEIFSVWKAQPRFGDALANRDGQYAVVHPDKMESE